VRIGGRTLVIDGADRVLLVGSVNPDPAGAVIWVPPGGGANGGEDHRGAAARELREETGFLVRDSELGRG
jgi:ADP-ribose pyrophosphatase YjhB (NUDIX family)